MQGEERLRSPPSHYQGKQLASQTWPLQKDWKNSHAEEQHAGVKKLETTAKACMQ